MFTTLLLVTVAAAVRVLSRFLVGLSPSTHNAQSLRSFPCILDSPAGFLPSCPLVANTPCSQTRVERLYRLAF